MNKRTAQDFTKLLQNEKVRKVILLVGFALIGLIFISTFFSGGSESEASEVSEDTTQLLTTEQYAAELENRLIELLGKVDGVGSVSVMLTMDSATEYVYQSDQKTSDGERTGTDNESQKTSEREETIVLVDGENGKTALVKTQINPKIRGIVVVCDGGDNITVQSQITEMLTAAFDISSTRVSVVKASASSP